jgi:hypothetical protein
MVILFPLFIIILLSTFFGTKYLTGRGDIWASFASASFINIIVSTILSLTNPPLVSENILASGISIFIIAVIILIVTRD